jgi:hypothetical protein
MVLVAGGAFSIATASTTAVVTWPSSASASSAQLTSVSQPQLTGESQSELGKEEALRARLASQAKSQKEAAARKAAAQEAAARKAAQEAAAKKKAAAAKEAAAAAQKKVRAEESGTPEQIAQAMLSQFGWSSGQLSCLEPLWDRESGWNVYAYNASSGAYGIPQALPGSRMASAGANWQSSAYTQIKWGLEYIQGTYGSPCAAWAHEEDDGWY